MRVWKISPPNLSLARFELHLCTNSTKGIEQEISPCPCPQMYHSHAGKERKKGGITDNGRGFNPERLFVVQPLDGERTHRERVCRKRCSSVGLKQFSSLLFHQFLEENVNFTCVKFSANKSKVDFCTKSILFTGNCRSSPII